MELEEAFRHALDGDAILFVGAGFSLGARNRLNEDFPLGNGLAQHLMNALGEREVVPLQIASELYAQNRGEVGLLEFLNSHLGVSAVAPHHRVLVGPKWRRVYTTNYDAVFEVASHEEQRKVRPLELSPRIPLSEPGVLDCVHINGFLPNANVQNLNSALALSETAYLSDRLKNSPWAALLRSDVAAARAVIFIGYSLADLDIERILVAVPTVTRKCVFVAGPNPGLALRTSISKFGTLSSTVGVQAAAALLEVVRSQHEPTQRRISFSSFRAVDFVNTRQSSPTAQDVFDLLVKGEIDSQHLAQGLADDTPSYVVRRHEVQAISDLLQGGAPAIVVLSRLANGKTLLCEAIAAKMRDRFDVFIFAKNTLSLADEIRTLRTPSRPTLVVVDDYTRRFDVVRELRLGANANQYLLLTSRTPTHLTHRDQLQSILGEEVRTIEFRADALKEPELIELDTILAGSGLLGEFAGWPQSRRVKDLYDAKGAREFGGILLWLLDSPTIRARLAEVFAALQGQGDPQKVVIAAMVLTHIGQQPDIDDIANFIGARPINQTIFSENAIASDLIRFENRQAYPRSTLFAAATLRSLWNEGYVPLVMEEMLRGAWELRTDQPRYKLIARDLMRYSIVRRIVPTTNASQNVVAYYEQIRNLSPCVNNELFWLQYTLADIESKQFSIAERHLKQSYAIAARMRGYDTYQIDNVHALFLLTREIEEQNVSRSFQTFIEASRIINRQLRDRRNAYYSYRVASQYGGFWKRVAKSWAPEQRAVFIAACQTAYGFAAAAEPDLATMEDVIHCKEVLREILVEVGALSKD